jgi:hypothetical protein
LLWSLQSSFLSIAKIADLEEERQTGQFPNQGDIGQELLTRQDGTRYSDRKATPEAIEERARMRSNRENYPHYPVSFSGTWRFHVRVARTNPRRTSVPRVVYPTHQPISGTLLVNFITG